VIAPAGGGARTWAIVSVLVTAVLACTQRAPTPRGRTRLVTIGGAVTEIVFALGRGDDVVAVDSTSTFPPEARSRTVVGYQRTLSAEPILALDPDLVIATADAGPPAAIAQLRAAGVPVQIVPAATSPAEAATRVRAVGTATERGEPAARLAASLERDAAAAHARAIARPARPRVLFVHARGGGSLMVAGRGTAAAAMIALAGGELAVTDHDGYRALSAEAAVAASPDVIVVSQVGLDGLGGVEGVLAQPGLAATPAGRARRVVGIDDLLVLGFGPRLPTAIDTLAAAIAGRVSGERPRS